MTRRYLIVAATAALTVFTAFSAIVAHGALITFTVDPTQSSLTLSGTWGGEAIIPRGANSLVTSYTGTISATRNVNADTLQVTGASIVAQNNGFYFPPFNVGANYGFGPQNNGPLGSAIFQMGGFSFSLSSPVIASPSNFDASLLDGMISTGEIDFHLTPVGGTGSVPMTGTLVFAAGNASYSEAGGVKTLVLPISTEFTTALPPPPETSSPLDLHFTGTIVATTPEPSSLIMFAIGVYGASRRPTKSRAQK